MVKGLEDKMHEEQLRFHCSVGPRAEELIRSGAQC